MASPWQAFLIAVQHRKNTQKKSITANQSTRVKIPNLKNSLNYYKCLQIYFSSLNNLEANNFASSPQMPRDANNTVLASYFPRLSPIHSFPHFVQPSTPQQRLHEMHVSLLILTTTSCGPEVLLSELDNPSTQELIFQPRYLS